jgi:hypothetical protein
VDAHGPLHVYLDEGSLLASALKLERSAWRNKPWTNADGVIVEGADFTKTALHSLLRNPLYVGHIRAGEDLVQARHQAIVPEDLRCTSCRNPLARRLRVAAPGSSR